MSQTQTVEIGLLHGLTKKRRRGPLTRIACNTCRVKKLKCSGEASGCKRCQNNGLECYYENLSSSSSSSHDLAGAPSCNEAGDHGGKFSRSRTNSHPPPPGATGGDRQHSSSHTGAGGDHEQLDPEVREFDRRQFSPIPSTSSKAEPQIAYDSLYTNDEEIFTADAFNNFTPTCDMEIFPLSTLGTPEWPSNQMCTNENYLDLDPSEDLPFSLDATTTTATERSTLGSYPASATTTCTCNDHHYDVHACASGRSHLGSGLGPHAFESCGCLSQATLQHEDANIHLTWTIRGFVSTPASEMLQCLKRTSEIVDQLLDCRLHSRRPEFLSLLLSICDMMVTAAEYLNKKMTMNTANAADGGSFVAGHRPRRSSPHDVAASHHHDHHHHHHHHPNSSRPQSSTVVMEPSVVGMHGRSCVGSQLKSPGGDKYDNGIIRVVGSTWQHRFQLDHTVLDTEDQNCVLQSLLTVRTRRLGLLVQKLARAADKNGSPIHTRFLGSLRERCRLALSSLVSRELYEP